MKKIPQRVTKKLPPVVLYPHQLSDLYELLKKFFSEITIEVEDKAGTQYELEAIDEVRIAKLKKIEFVGQNKDNEGYTDYKGKLEISLSKSQAAIRYHEDAITAKAVGADIFEILSQNKRQFYKTMNSGRTTALAWFIMALSPVLLPEPFGIVIAIFALVIFFFPIITSVIGMSDIAFMPNPDDNSFLKRNKDRILVGLLVGIVMLGIGFFLSKLAAFLPSK